jgi:HPt (histidine-containing phosphotransfer) domain-containing protein
MASEPLDLGELHRQAGGDEKLIREVLGLFLVHAPVDMTKLAGATGYERRVLAHRLVGSGRGVGAAEVARLAAAVEGGSDADVPSLAAAVEEALRFFRAYLAGDAGSPQTGEGPRNRL